MTRPDVLRADVLEKVHELATLLLASTSATDYPQNDPQVAKDQTALFNYLHEIEDDDLLKEDLSTRLSYKESLAIKEAIRLALRAERHRLQYYAAINNDDFTVDSELMKRLNLAFEIIRLREQPAEEMGKY